MEKRETQVDGIVEFGLRGRVISVGDNALEPLIGANFEWMKILLRLMFEGPEIERIEKDPDVYRVTGQHRPRNPEYDALVAKADSATVTIPHDVFSDLNDRAELTNAEYIYLQHKKGKSYKELADEINKGLAVQRLRRELFAAINKLDKPATVSDLREAFNRVLNEVGRNDEDAPMLRREIKQLRDIVYRARTAREFLRAIEMLLNEVGPRYIGRPTDAGRIKQVSYEARRQKRYRSPMPKSYPRTGKNVTLPFKDYIDLVHRATMTNEEYVYHLFRYKLKSDLKKRGLLTSLSKDVAEQIKSGKIKWTRRKSGPVSWRSIRSVVIQMRRKES